MDEAERFFFSAKKKKGSTGKWRQIGCLSCSKQRAHGCSGNKGPNVAKLGKFLLGLKNSIKGGDRILILANSNGIAAKEVDRKGLKQFFGADKAGKMLYVPCPDYDTRQKLWTSLIQEAVNLSSLSVLPTPKTDE